MQEILYRLNKMLVHQILPNFRSSVASGRFRPFAIMVRAACRRN